jgi:hypothetical protein
MGRIVRQHVHNYGTESFNDQVFSIQELVAKVLAREKVFFTVIFVGETHNTLDERRRTLLYGFRPGTAQLLTVVERGLGMPDTQGNLLTEPDSALTSGDPQRDTNMVNGIANLYAQNRFKAVFILFGENHEHKFRERMMASAVLPEMVWHMYPSFSDHTITTKQVFEPYDPRAQGYTLMGMLRLTAGTTKIDFQQLAEGIMPPTAAYSVWIASPFNQWETTSNYAIFARDPVLTAVQNTLRADDAANLTVTAANIRDIRVVDIEGRVRPIPREFKVSSRRNEIASNFWVDAV